MHKSLIFTEAGITIRALQGFTTKTKTLREKRKSRKGQKKKEKRTRIHPRSSQSTGEESGGHHSYSRSPGF